MIELKNVSKSYIRVKDVTHSVDDVSVTVNKGETVGIVGSSGAGKSTLLRLLNGLIGPTRGDIYIDGVNITLLKNKELNHLRRKIGIIFQSYNLLSSQTVYENIALNLRINHYPRQEIRKKIEEVLSSVGLLHKINEYPKSLSGGEKQRVAIARAIVNDPEYLLCDEITSALDQKTAHEIVEVLRNIHESTGITIVFVSHQLDIVARLCERILVMDSGKIVEDQKTLPLFFYPHHQAGRNLVQTVINYDRFNGKDHYLLVYGQKTIDEPLLSRAITDYQIEPSIKYAKSLEIGRETVGFLIMKIEGSLRMRALSFFTENDVLIRQLGEEYDIK